jgi:hypothetical protein
MIHAKTGIAGFPASAQAGGGMANVKKILSGSINFIPAQLQALPGLALSINKPSGQGGCINRDFKDFPHDLK